MSIRSFSGLARFGALTVALVAGLVLGSPGGAAFSSTAADPGPTGGILLPDAPGSYSFANCRYGMTAWESQMDQFDIVANLNVGSYLDFGTRKTPPGPPEAEYVRTLYVGQNRPGTDVCGPDYGFIVQPALTSGSLGAIVDANPGGLWVVGNEPDRKWQGDICPQQYADAYHAVYDFIKGRDPTAQIAVSGLVLVSPGRLQYLDIVWDTYVKKYGTAMPVDVWTMHAYVLSETGEGDAHIALGTDPGIAIPYSSNCADPDTYCHAEHDDINLFSGQVVAMREWMKDHGQQNRPLVITEYGVLKPYHYYGFCSVEVCPPEGDPEGCFCDENKETFHPTRVADFAEATFDYMMTATDPALGHPADEHRLVQQWLWYSLATTQVDGVGHASNLVDPSSAYTLTIPGQRWQDYVRAISPTVNLLPTRVPLVTGWVPDGADSVTVTLSAEVMNGGNVAVTGTVTVEFYSNEALTASIGSAVFAGLGGCARHLAVVTTTWESLGPGSYPFWVKADSPETVPESLETDNVMQGLVMIDPSSLFLPLVTRWW